MKKEKLDNTELKSMLTRCYSSDKELIEKFHVLSGSSIEDCVNRTCQDFFSCKVDIFVVLSDSGDFIGYFGEEFLDNEKWLSGFFIMPEHRKTSKDVWKLIKEHFNCDFKVGLFTKNKRAKRFIMKNGGQLEQIILTKDGLGEIFICKNEVI